MRREGTGNAVGTVVLMSVQPNDELTFCHVVVVVVVVKFFT